MKNFILAGIGFLFLMTQLKGKEGNSPPRRNVLPPGTPPSTSSGGHNATLRKIGKPTLLGRFRECDPKGCGYYGAPRGNRKHKGVDYALPPGGEVLSPIKGKVTRYPDPYGDRQFSGIEIQGVDEHSHLRVKIFYMVPSVRIGESIYLGKTIGHAQDIRKRHGSSMTNHIHVELYKNGVNTDITAEPSW